MALLKCGQIAARSAEQMTEAERKADRIRGATIRAATNTRLRKVKITLAPIPIKELDDED